MHHAVKDQVCAIRPAFLDVRDGLKIFKEGGKSVEIAVVQLAPRAHLGEAQPFF